MSHTKVVKMREMGKWMNGSPAILIHASQRRDAKSISQRDHSWHSRDSDSPSLFGVFGLSVVQM